MNAQDANWYKDSVIYELHVRAFRDGTGDGNGDFTGLVEKLPYLQDLGVDCLWLLPFYPSPLRDDGYDIADYRSIHPDFGDMKAFRKFLRQAHRLGMKVVTELVVNHTSDRHPWFQRARNAPRGSSDRNWYVWSDSSDRWPEVRIIFTDTETSNWTWDPIAGQYYWHRFFSHQPDLNFEHPPVRNAIEKVMRFWLDEGVDGLRLDAIPYLFERDGTNGENLPETHEYIKRLRRTLDLYTPRRLFLAEANQWPEDVRAYFGDDDECQMAFHFPLMPRLFMALAQEDRHPVVEIMNRTPPIPPACQWALFLRNHDELTLEMVTDKERDYMLRAYAANPRMRINVGIRRRLAPLLENSRPRIELLTAILLSMPGTPVLYYGDEIGMGDNIYLGDRNGVRTPMQWNADRNAGFSSSEPSRLFAPLIQDPVYHYAAVNVESQEKDPSSLLNWNRRMIRLRRTSNAFGRGTFSLLEPSNRRILAYVRRLGEETILVVANLSKNPQAFSLELEEFHGSIPIEMRGDTPFPPIGKTPWPLALGPWGWMWFRLKPSSSLAQADLADLPLIEQEEEGAWWMDRLAKVQFLATVLPGWIPGCNWLRSAPNRTLASVDSVELEACNGDTSLLSLELSFSDEEVSTVRIPVSLVSEEEGASVCARSPHSALCRLRRPNGQILVLLETPSSLAALAQLDGCRTGTSTCALRWEPTEMFQPSSPGPRVSLQGKHLIASLPDGSILKWYPEGGPSIERSRRILTQLGRAGFTRSPRLMGTFRSTKDGEICGLLLERIENQGRLDSRLELEATTFLEANRFDAGASTESTILPTLELVAELVAAVRDLQAHLEGPQQWDAHRRGLFVGTTRELLTRASKIIHPGPREPQRRLRDHLWERVSVLANSIHEWEWSGSAHGDLHLGQVLIRDERMVFLDFDGSSADTDSPLPRAWDLACLGWSMWKLAHRVFPTDSPACQLWLQGAMGGLFESQEAPGNALAELCILRRWAEEITSDPSPHPDIEKLLSGQATVNCLFSSEASAARTRLNDQQRTTAAPKKAT